MGAIISIATSIPMKNKMIMAGMEAMANLTISITILPNLMFTLLTVTSLSLLT